MADPALTTDQNILPVQAYFNLDGSFNTFLGQGQPFVVSATESIGIINTTASGTFYPTFAAVNTGQVTSLSVTSSKLSFNPSTGVLSSSFAGPLNGNASTATNIQSGGANTLVYQSSSGNTAFLTNGTTGQVLTANTGSAPTWTTPTFYASVTDDTTTNATRYPLYANQTSGSLTTEYTSSTKFQYNPSTGLLSATGFSGSGANLTNIPNGALTNSSITVGSTAISLGGTATTIAGLTSVTSTTFVGALTGNASTATSATTATNATNIAITDNTGSSSTWYPVISTNSSGNNPATTSSTKLSFVPNTGTLSATVFSGSGASLTSIPNGALSNSTISGVALGGNLFNLTAGTNITFSSGTTYNGSAAITINASSTMVYPGSGIPNSTGSAWGTSYSTSGTGTVVALATSASLTTPTVTGGTIDNAVIGGTTPAAGTFTTITGQTEVLKGSGTNLVLQSQALATSPWNNTSNITATNNSSTAPDGTSTATKLVPTTTNGNHYSLQNIGSATSNSIYTLSFYVKAAGYTAVTIANTPNAYLHYDLTNVVTSTLGTGWASATITAVSGATGWYRCTATNSSGQSWGGLYISVDNAFVSSGNSGFTSYAGDGTSGVYIWGVQVEQGTVANTYVPTTTTAIFGGASLSFQNAASISLDQFGALSLQPAGTGALQAQATTSSTVGGNARGANAVDWQTARGNANQVAGSAYSAILGGSNNRAGNSWTVVNGGYNNAATGNISYVGGGSSNTSSSDLATVIGGQSNIAGGYYNLIGGGASNSGTSASAVTTQGTTTVTSGSTAVTLSGSNASIKVGQLITGTGINSYTYVAAISGTSLTLSQNASASGTPTLSFYTPHGVVVGGGNNQATGSYSFIGGGGDAGTAANRNVASGDYSFIGGGRGNIASNVGAAVVGGGFANDSTARGNTASGAYSFVGAGYLNTASGVSSAVLGGTSNSANSSNSVVFGTEGTSRSIAGYAVFAAHNNPINSSLGTSQSALIVLGTQTTDATATVLRSDSGVASTTNQVILPDNSAYLFKATVIANVTGGGNTSGWKLEGVIKRGSGVGTAAIVGLVTTTLLAQDAGAATWAVTATADTTNGGLKITVTGQASTTIRWVAKVDTTEVTF